MKQTEATEEIMQIIPAPEDMAAVYVDGNGRFEAAERVVCLALVEVRPVGKMWYKEVRPMVMDGKLRICVPPEHFHGFDRIDFRFSDRK